VAALNAADAKNQQALVAANGQLVDARLTDGPFVFSLFCSRRYGSAMTAVV
jgi:hypothetical protein